MLNLPLHQVSMSVLMTPHMANFSGNVHGGTVLKYLDEVAYACASRYAASYVVTMAVDQVTFRQPLYVGELVTFMASVNLTGRSSMEIGIKVIAENTRQRTVRHTNSCYFTMVALGDDGKPCQIPGFEPTTDAEKRWNLAARRRRELRQDLEREHAAIRTGKRSDT